jgi:hypothetical protein
MSALYPALLKQKKRESLSMKAAITEPAVISYGREGREAVASFRA